MSDEPFTDDEEQRIKELVREVLREELRQSLTSTATNGGPLGVETITDEEQRDLFGLDEDGSGTLDLRE